MRMLFSGVCRGVRIRGGLHFDQGLTVIKLRQRMA